MAIFTATELSRRQVVIAKSLTEAGIDAAIFTSADNMYYTTGVPLLSEWGRPMWSVLFPDARSVVIGAEIEQETMTGHALTSKVVTFGDGGSVLNAAIDLVVAEITHSGFGVIGIETENLPLQVYEALKDRFPGARFVDVGPIVAEVRLIKSEEEAVILRVAAEVAKVGANAFLEALTPGNTELAVAGHARSAMDKALGALYPSGATSSYVYSQFGENSMTPHLHATGRRLKRGDIVALNVFPVVWGYCIELERTYVYGTRTQRQEELLDVLDRSFTLGKELFAPGKRLDELHADCTNVLAEAGLDSYIRHGTGHSHGIMIGSASREHFGEIREYNPRPVTVGMFNSIEPGFYIPGEGGFRHSDVMEAVDDSARCITDFPIRLDL
jgi:Xaa-Pro aminopeptidase